MTEVSTRITVLAEPLAASLDLSLWGVDVQFGPRSMVRVYVEKEGGVSIDDCAELSRLLGLTLEVEDVMENAYVLEVSSPGLERIFFTLEQLAGACGKKVELLLYSPLPEYPGRRKYAGILKSVDGEMLRLTLEDVSVTGDAQDEIAVSWAGVRKARQLYVAPEKSLPGKGPAKKGEKKKKVDGGIKEGMDADDLA